MFRSNASLIAWCSFLSFRLSSMKLFKSYSILCMVFIISEFSSNTSSTSWVGVFNFPCWLLSSSVFMIWTVLLKIPAIANFFNYRKKFLFVNQIQDILYFHYNECLLCPFGLLVLKLGSDTTCNVPQKWFFLRLVKTTYAGHYLNLCGMCHTLFTIL